MPPLAHHRTPALPPSATQGGHDRLTCPFRPHCPDSPPLSMPNRRCHYSGHQHYPPVPPCLASLRPIFHRPTCDPRPRCWGQWLCGAGVRRDASGLSFSPPRGVEALVHQRLSRLLPPHLWFCCGMFCHQRMNRHCSPDFPPSQRLSWVSPVFFLVLALLLAAASVQHPAFYDQRLNRVSCFAAS